MEWLCREWWGRRLGRLGRRLGGWGGWVGPVFWPFLLGDLFSYALWPYDYYYPFWSYGTALDYDYGPYVPAYGYNGYNGYKAIAIMVCPTYTAMPRAAEITSMPRARIRFRQP